MNFLSSVIGIYYLLPFYGVFLFLLTKIKNVASHLPKNKKHFLGSIMKNLKSLQLHTKNPLTNKKSVCQSGYSTKKFYGITWKYLKNNPRTFLLGVGRDNFSTNIVKKQGTSPTLVVGGIAKLQEFDFWNLISNVLYS